MPNWTETNSASLPESSTTPSPQANIRTILQNELRQAQRVAVLAIGSECHGDDIAGLLVARHLLKCRSAASAPPEPTPNDSAPSSPTLAIFEGATAPENLTGDIKRFQPTHLIVVDAAGLGSAPGAIRILKTSDIGGTSFSTHSIPPTLLLDYLSRFFAFQTIVIAIQPATVEYGAPLSPAIDAAALEIASAIQSALASPSKKSDEIA